MAAQDQRLRRPDQVPKPHRLVVPGCNQAPAMGIELDVFHVVFVAPQDPLLHAPGCVTEPSPAVEASSLLSGEKATLCTPLLRDTGSSRTSRPVRGSQSFTSPGPP